MDPPLIEGRPIKEFLFIDARWFPSIEIEDLIIRDYLALSTLIDCLSASYLGIAIAAWASMFFCCCLT